MMPNREKVMIEDYTTQEEEIQFLKDRIKWIDVHETMFELSPMLVMEREYCKKKLKELITKRQL